MYRPLPLSASDVGSDLRRIASHIATHWPVWARLAAAASLVAAILSPLLAMIIVTASRLS